MQNHHVNVDQQIEMDRQSSTGSLLSLMSAQSALNMMAPPSVVSRYSMYVVVILFPNEKSREIRNFMCFISNLNRSGSKANLYTMILDVI